jgi:hypothetical protein
MDEWNNPKFEELLTSSIWASNIKAIKKKLYLKYWDEPKYKHLLAPSIFSLSLKNIDENISLLEEYDISKYITFACMRRNSEQLRNLINYMQDSYIPLLLEDENSDFKLNPILNANNKKMKEKYNIDIKQLKSEGVRNGRDL